MVEIRPQGLGVTEAMLIDGVVGVTWKTARFDVGQGNLKGSILTECKQGMLDGSARKGVHGKV